MTPNPFPGRQVMATLFVVAERAYPLLRSMVRHRGRTRGGTEYKGDRKPVMVALILAIKGAWLAGGGGSAPFRLVPFETF